MDHHQVFTPADIVDDWNRFGHSWVQLVNPRGQDSGRGLCELYSVRAGTGRGRISWQQATVHLKTSEGSLVELSGIPSGSTLRFAPPWKHKGFTMIDTHHGCKCYWMSLSSNRQYRWGLSDRAFIRRYCSSLFQMGGSTYLNLSIAAPLFRDGPKYVSWSRLDLAVSQAISPALAILPASGNVSALSWNAKKVIGLLHDGQLLVEQRSRGLVKSMPTSYRSHVNYVHTSELASLFQEQVLPETMANGPIGDGFDIDDRELGVAIEPRRLRNPVRGLSSAQIRELAGRVPGPARREVEDVISSAARRPASRRRRD